MPCGEGSIVPDFSESKLSDAMESLLPNLISFSRELRLKTLSILAGLESKDNKSPLFYSSLLKIENIEPDFFSYRQRCNELQRIILELSDSSLNAMKSIVYFLVSHFSINLNVIHPIIEKIITYLYQQPSLNSTFITVWTGIFIKSVQNLVKIYYSPENECVNCSCDGTFNEHEFKFHKEEINMYRKILDITLNFKSVLHDNSFFIFDRLKYLYSHFPQDISMSFVEIDVFYKNYPDSNIYLWKEMFIFFVKSFEANKYVEDLPFSQELFEIVFATVPIYFSDVSKVCVSCLSNFRSKITFNSDFVLQFYDLSSLQRKEKLSQLSQFINEYPDLFPIMVRCLFSIISSKKSKEKFNHIYKTLFNSLSSNRIGVYFEYLMDFFLPDYNYNISTLDKFLNPKFTEKLLFILSDLIQDFQQSFRQYFSKIFVFLINLCQISYIILKDNSVAKKFHILFKNNLISIYKLFLVILESGYDPSEYLNRFDAIMTHIITSHSNADLKDSYFIDLIHGLSQTDSCEYILSSKVHSEPLLVHIFSCITASMPIPKLLLTLKTTSNILNKVRPNSFENLASYIPILAESVRQVISFETLKHLELLELVNNIAKFSKRFTLDESLIIDLIQTLIQIKLPPINIHRKAIETNLVECVCCLVSQIKSFNEIMDQFLLWQIGIQNNHLCKKVNDTLFTQKIFQKEVYDVIIKLNSSQVFGDNDGPDISTRCEALKSIDYDFLKNYQFQDFVLVNIFINCLRSFDACMDQSLLPLSFCSFLGHLLRVINKEHTYYTLITDLVKDKCRKLLRSRKEQNFNAGILLFSSMIRHELLVEFNPLAECEDLFVNIIHLQMVRKIGAIRNLNELISSGNFSKNMIEKYILPIGLYFVTNEKSADKSCHNVTNEGINLIGTVASKISWSSYKILLKNFLKDTNFIYDEGLKEHKKHARVLSTILDNFPFDVSDEPASNCVLRKNLVSLVDNLMNKLQSKSICEQNKAWMPAFTDVRDSIIKAPLCLVIIKLMKKLQDPITSSSLHEVIGFLSEMLASQHKDMRVSGRTVLKSTLLILGPSYLSLIIKNLKLSLKDGYQKHVYLYTIHFLISELDDTYSNDINIVIGDLIDAIITDQFGLIYEERQVHTITSKTKEAYKGKGSELCRIIGKHIHSDNIMKFLKSFSSMETSLNLHTALNTVEKCFKRFFDGLKSNYFINIDSILNIVKVCIEEYMPSKENSENLKITSIKTISNRLIPPDPRKVSFINSALTLQLNHLIVCWGLKVLYFVLTDRVNDSETVKCIMNSHFHSILLCIESPFVQIAAKSFLCLKYFIKNNFDLLADKSTTLLQIVYSYVREMINSDMENDDIVIGLKVMVLILRTHSSKIDKDMAKNLVIFSENNILASKSSAPLALLRVIIEKRLEKSQIILTINVIGNLSISTYDSQLKTSCHRLIILFLKHYKRRHLKNYMELCLANLDHETIDGRISSLELLNMIIVEIKRKRWAEYRNDIYLRLFQFVANNVDKTLITLAYDVISNFLTRTTLEIKDKWLQRLIVMIKNLNFDYIDTSCIFVRAFTETDPMFLENHSSFINVLYDTTKNLLDMMGYFSGESSSDVSTESDIILFKLINLITFIHRKFKFTLSDKYRSISIEIIELVYNVCKYPHIWVKHACVEFVLEYILSVGVRTIAKSIFDKENSENQPIWTPDIEKMDDFIDEILELSNSELCSVSESEIGIKLIVILSEIICSATKDDSSSAFINLEGVFQKLLKSANDEYQSKPKNSRCRVLLLKWIAGIISLSSVKKAIISREKCEIQLKHEFLVDIMKFVNKVIHLSNRDKILTELSESVLDLIKKTIPHSTFIDVMNESNLYQNEVRKHNKSMRAILKTKNTTKYYQSRKKMRIKKDAKKAIKSRLRS